MKAALPPELEMAIREQVAARLRVWVITVGTVLLTQLVILTYLAVELRKMKAEAVLLDRPVMIYNPAWDTVLDAVDPARFPGAHRDDARKGTLIQQWPAHGGPQHIWELRQPYGERYQPDASVPKPENPAQR